jgi:CelD/BcsL family acetyltransferase involved in cellulose biosynthesis
MKLSLISDLRSMEAIKAQWNELLRESTTDSVFLTYEWFYNFVKSFQLDDRLLVVLIHEGDLVGILPMYKETSKYLGLKFVALKSLTNVHSPKFGFIIRAGFEDRIFLALHDLRSRIHWDMVELHYVVEDVWLDQAAQGNAKRWLKVSAVNKCASPHLVIKSDWQEYWERGFPKALRNDIKRLERQGEAKYGLTFQTISGASLQHKDLKDAFEIENSGWKGKNRSSILNNAQVKAFYSSLAWAMNDVGWFELFFLTMGDRRVAFEYCLKYGKCIAPPKIGYDDEFSRYAPGNILRKRVLEYAFAKGMERYDLLGATDPYKLKWTNGVDKLLSVYLFNRRTKSAILKFILFDVGRAIRRLGLRDVVEKCMARLPRRVANCHEDDDQADR